MFDIKNMIDIPIAIQNNIKPSIRFIFVLLFHFFDLFLFKEGQDLPPRHGQVRHTSRPCRSRHPHQGEWTKPPPGAFHRHGHVIEVVPSYSTKSTTFSNRFCKELSCIVISPELIEF